jgi:hypothetical protein
MNKSSCRSNFVSVMLASLRHSLIGVVATTAMLVIPPPAAAQQHHHYKLIDLGTLGGTRSYVSPGSGNELGQFLACTE